MQIVYIFLLYLIVYCVHLTACFNCTKFTKKTRAQTMSYTLILHQL